MLVAVGSFVAQGEMKLWPVIIVASAAAMHVAVVTAPKSMPVWMSNIRPESTSG